MSTAEWAWDQQSRWSQSAGEAKGKLDQRRRWIAGLTIGTAIAALAASQFNDGGVRSAGFVLAATGAVAGAVLAAIQQSVKADRIRRWTLARSTSEAIKAEVFMFLAQAGRYHSTSSETLLQAEITRIEAAADELQAAVEGKKPVPRALPPVSDPASYLTVRVVQSQCQDYFEPQIAALNGKISTLRFTQLALAAAAALLSAVAAWNADVGAWAAVVTTAGGAFGSYLAAERYEFLVIEYGKTLHELRRLAQLKTAVDGTALSDSGVVVACEQVLGAQNGAWMAKLSKDDG